MFPKFKSSGSAPDDKPQGQGQDIETSMSDLDKKKSMSVSEV